LKIHKTVVGRSPLARSTAQLSDVLANDQRLATNDYNPSMIDENDFRKHADRALDSLKKALITAEESSDMEVEDQSGALHISFQEGSRFIISPNAPVKQIWISALSTSFKLDWSETDQDFVLQKTAEKLKPLVARLINEQLGEETVTLA
jgi:frataxin